MIVRKIEINFAKGVELTNDVEQQLLDVADAICRAYEFAHPGRVMWPAGIGGKITFLPLTAEDERERGIEFDDDTFEIDCYEREDYGDDGEYARRLNAAPPWRPQHPCRPIVTNVSWGARFSRFADELRRIAAETDESNLRELAAPVFSSSQHDTGK